MKKGWQVRCLGDVATVSAGNSAPQGEAHFDGGTIPFFRTADAGRVRFGDIDAAADCLNEDGAKGLRRFARGTILFPKSGASTFLNHRVILGVEGCVSSHLATIVADGKQAHARFLLYFLSTIAAQDLVQDHAYPSLNLPTIEGIEVNLPPLAEQRRIVGILDEAFAGLATVKANAEKNLRNARALFEGYLHSVFTRRGEGWVEKSLGETCKIYQPKTIGTKDLVPHGPYAVFGANGIIGRYDRFNHEEPQLLVTCRGATCGAVNVSEPKSWITGNAMVVQPKDHALDLKFLEFVFRGGIDLSQAITGAAQPQITRTNLSPLPIRFPKSIGEQKQFAAACERLTAETRHLEAFCRKKLSALEALKNSLLHQAFTGAL